MTPIIQLFRNKPPNSDALILIALLVTTTLAHFVIEMIQQIPRFVP